MSFAIRFLLKNKSLRYPQFRSFLTMRLTLILALNMQFTIINFWIYRLTHDVWALGKLGLWEAVPAVLCSLFSGHFVDQREKKGMLLQCIIGYLLLSAFFAVTSTENAAGHLGITATEYLIYTGVFIGGVIRAFVSPSAFALMGMLLPREEYPNGTTWSSTAWQTGAVVGPLVAGFLIAFTHLDETLRQLDWTLWIVFIIQLIALVATVRISKQPILNKEKEPILKSLKEGLSFVFKTQVVLAALSLDMFAVLFGGAVALLPAYQELLHANGFQYGLMQAAPGIGSVLTLFLLSFIPIKTNPGMKLLACIIGFGVSTIVFGISGNFYLAFFMLLLTGMFDAVSVVIRGTILQLKTPDEMRGRVSAVNTMFISSSNEIGRAESGLTAKWMGTVPAVVFGGIMTIVVVIVTYFAAPAIRKLDLSAKPEKK
ncbi:MFS transporter [Chitinophagaceae bacterium MMS25-I14]